jgi:D-lactate dehydrogenase
MKAVVYSTQPFEKELLAKANNKKHDITLISNSLSLDTAFYAEGKDAVIVFTNDCLDEATINKLAGYGIRYISTRSVSTDHIDRVAAAKNHIKVANIPSHTQNSIAEHTIALALTLNRKIIPGAIETKKFDYYLDGLTSFNFFGKTVGIIGFGNIGTQAAAIFSAFGCKIMVHDTLVKHIPHQYQLVGLEKLLAHADIISLHIPSTDENRHLINSSNISRMKNGVMLLNTSASNLVDYYAVLKALKAKKIGYFGSTIYEDGGRIYFNDRDDGQNKLLIEELKSLKNVILSPQQTFLTHEALQEIANQTIRNLDNWHLNKCTGKACACLDNCKKDEAIAAKAAVNIII